MKYYAVFDLAVLACVIAVGRKLLLSNNKNVGVDHTPSTSTPPSELELKHRYQPEPEPDEAPEQREFKAGDTDNHDCFDPVVPDADVQGHQHYKGFNVGDLVEVQDPKITNHHRGTHHFVAEIINMLSYGNGTVKFGIHAEVPALQNLLHNNEYLMSNDERGIVAQIPSSVVKPFVPYDYHTPIICDYSMDSGSRNSFVPCRVLSYAKRSRDNHELGFHMELWLNEKVEYRWLPLRMISRYNDDDMVTAPTDMANLFNSLIATPKHQSKIEGLERPLGRVAILLVGSSRRYSDPVIIVGYDEEDGKYDIIHALHGTSKTIKPEYLRPYEILPDGTTGWCNIAENGAKERLEMRPCTILSHSTRKVGFVYYQVAITPSGADLEKKRDQVLMTKELSFSKIRGDR